MISAQKTKGNSVAQTVESQLSMVAFADIAYHKCTKQQFIHLLTAAFKDLHIKNSKNHKKVILPASH